MKLHDICGIVPSVTPGISVSSKGHLLFWGVDTTELVNKYGSPLYVMSEERIRENCGYHLAVLRKHLGADSRAAYASKAFSCRQIYRIAGDEGMCTDVVSSGELYTALSAGFDPLRIIFHGNNKTQADISYAIKNGIWLLVADSITELDNISRAAVNSGIRQKVLLRVTPGIDPHTHEKINTGRIDSKFGVPIGNGQAADAVRYALGLPGIALEGFHYHIGSQITESSPFADAMENTLAFLYEMRTRLGYTAKILNIGGGFGIRYTDDAPATDYEGIFSALAAMLTAFCESKKYPRPMIITEPGRSIVADAGITLYTVGGVKTIPGYRSYVSVDGGMTDNPRFALYGAIYCAVVAGKADRTPDFRCSVVGRCCESGDIIIPDIMLASPTPGDILSVLNTGAYNYSMSSNYNRIPRPPVIMLKNGSEYTAVRRETPEDVAALDE